MNPEGAAAKHAEELKAARKKACDRGCISIRDAKASEVGTSVNIVGIVERVRPEYVPKVKWNGRIWNELVRFNMLIRDEENRTILRVLSHSRLEELYKKVRPGNMVFALGVVHSTTSDSQPVSCFDGRWKTYWVVENPTYRRSPKIYLITRFVTCKNASDNHRKLYSLIKNTPRASLLGLLGMADDRIRRIVVRVTAIETSPLVDGTTVYVTDYYKPEEFQAAYTAKGEPMAQPGLAVNFVNLTKNINVGEFYCLEGLVARDRGIVYFRVDAKDYGAIREPSTEELNFLSRAMEDYNIHVMDHGKTLPLENVSKYIKCNVDSYRHPTISIYSLQNNSVQDRVRVAGMLFSCQLFRYPRRRVVLTLGHENRTIQIQLSRETFFENHVASAKHLVDNYILNRWIIVGVHGKLPTGFYNGVETCIPDSVADICGEYSVDDEIITSDISVSDNEADEYSMLEPPFNDDNILLLKT
jgi:hypothetical protein